MLWLGGLESGMPVSTGLPGGAPGGRSGGGSAEPQAEVKELTHQVQRLSLLNQALWELIRDRLQLTDAQLEEMARQVDLRDGVEDGKMTAQPVRCPACSRVSNSKHFKCLYCGQLFERPLFG